MRREVCQIYFLGTHGDGVGLPWHCTSVLSLSRFITQPCSLPWGVMPNKFTAHHVCLFLWHCPGKLEAGHWARAGGCARAQQDRPSTSRYALSPLEIWSLGWYRSFQQWYAFNALIKLLLTCWTVQRVGFRALHPGRQAGRGRRMRQRCAWIWEPWRKVLWIWRFNRMLV